MMILIHGIMPDLEKYTLSLDKMYLQHRQLMDLTHMGRIEKSSEICNEMSKIIRQDLNQWRFLF